MTYPDRLEEAIREKGNPCLVGLDPHIALLPDEFAAARDTATPIAERARVMGDFLCEVIGLVADRVAAVKPQSAFFEAFGAPGAVQWERIVKTAHEAGLLVIGDVKRGDIGSTAEAYATAFLEGLPGCDRDTLCDAVTLNPYLGSDAIAPFLAASDRTGAGLYVLVRTSNPSSAEFQAVGEPCVSDRVAEAVDRWGAERCGESGFSRVGAVVGATHPDQLARLRERMPRAPLLLPGFGAQGAGAADVIPGFREGLSGALVNSSRGILFAGRNQPDLPWRDACNRAVDEMVNDLRDALLAAP